MYRYQKLTSLFLISTLSSSCSDMKILSGGDGSSAVEPATFEGSLTIDFPPEGKLLRSGVKLEGECVSGLPVVVGGAAPLQGFELECEDGRYQSDLSFHQATPEGDKTLVVRQTNARGASKTVTKVLSHFEFSTYVAVVSREAKKILLYVSRVDDGRLKEVALSEELPVIPERIFAAPSIQRFYVTNQGTSLRHFSVHSHVAQMSPLEITAADDGASAAEVGTVPSEVVFSENGEYAYVMRRSPTGGVDVMTAYAMNPDTGQLSLLESDPANSLYNRLLFSDSGSIVRPRSLEMTMGSDGAFTSLEGSTRFVKIRFAASGQIVGAGSEVGGITAGPALTILNRKIDRLYYLMSPFPNGNINYSFAVNPDNAFMLSQDLTVFEVPFNHSMKGLFGPNGDFMFSSLSGQGSISRYSASQTLTYMDAFTPETGVTGDYELAMDAQGSRLFAAHSMLSKIFSLNVGPQGALAGSAVLAVPTKPSAIAVISLP